MAARHPDLSHVLWRKSTRSSSTGQNCVEVATNLPGVVAVRDSTNLDGPKLLVSSAAWLHFVLTLKGDAPG